MPRNTREYLKRYIGEANNDLDRFMGQCIRIRDIYNPVHPQYGEFFDALAAQALELQKALNAFDQQIA
jgi:hypothetical protein